MIVSPARRKMRPGLVAVWVLAVFGVITVLSGAALYKLHLAQRDLNLRRNRVQAEWLARSGVELAVAKLLGAADYRGEKATPIPGGEVTIVVAPDPAEKGRYRVESSARYSASTGLVVFASKRTLQRTDGPKGAEIKLLPE